MKLLFVNMFSDQSTMRPLVILFLLSWLQAFCFLLWCRHKCHGPWSMVNGCEVVSSASLSTLLIAPLLSPMVIFFSSSFLLVVYFAVHVVEYATRKVVAYCGWACN